MIKIKCFMVEREENQFGDHQWRNLETDEVYRHLSDIPPGGMWDATYYQYQDSGQIAKDLERNIGMRDDRCLVVMTPGGQLFLDGRHRDCDKPDEPLGDHFCFERNGSWPAITVPASGCTKGRLLLERWSGYLIKGHLINA